jgi:hypothetical protein
MCEAYNEKRGQTESVLRNKIRTEGQAFLLSLESSYFNPTSANTAQLRPPIPLSQLFFSLYACAKISLQQDGGGGRAGGERGRQFQTQQKTSVVDPDPVGLQPFGRIRIRKKSFRIRAAPDPKCILHKTKTDKFDTISTKCSI